MGVGGGGGMLQPFQCCRSNGGCVCMGGGHVTTISVLQI